MNKLSIIVSSPSGGGKTTICKKLISDSSSPLFNKAKFSISATTRGVRAGEEHGKDYHFLSLGEFEEKIKNNEFLEHANVFGKLYGTLKSEISQEKHTIFDIDVEGHKQIKAQDIECLSIFLLPPSMDILKQRVKARGDLQLEEMEKRLKQAEMEIKEAKNYDFVIINQDLNQTFKTICDIVSSYHIKLNPSLIENKTIFTDLSF